MQRLRHFLLVTLGTIVGGALGFASPIAVGFAFAATDGFKPGGAGSVGIVFALMIPYSTLFGAVAGNMLTVRKLKTGRWLNEHGAILPGQHGNRSPYARVTLSQTVMPLTVGAELLAEAPPHAKAELLESVLTSYRVVEQSRGITLGLIAAVSILVWPLSIAFIVVLARTIFEVVHCYREVNAFVEPAFWTSVDAPSTIPRTLRWAAYFLRR